LKRGYVVKWSFKIGRLAGVDIFLHLTFILIPLLFAWSEYGQSASISAAFGAALFSLLLFSCVVLHELGHALAARRYGIATRDITLYPIGGLARLERIPEDPWQEFVVAIAGPAVNVVIAAGLYGIYALTNGLAVIEGFVWEKSAFQQLMFINVALVVFNLLPAYPMDGGRVLRALLAMRLDYVRATNIAANVGQTMALLFAVVGILWNPFLVFIAIIVWMGASGEANMVQVRYALSGLPVQHAMITDYETLEPNDPLYRAVEHIIAGFQTDFPILENGRVVGILTRKDLMRQLSEEGRDGPVSHAMKSDFQTAEAGERLDRAFERLQNCEVQTMPVLRNGTLVGILTAENVGEFLMVQSALKGRR
jgi:Zn-dependent protease